MRVRAIAGTHPPFSRGRPRIRLINERPLLRAWRCRRAGYRVALLRTISNASAALPAVATLTLHDSSSARTKSRASCSSSTTSTRSPSTRAVARVAPAAPASVASLGLRCVAGGQRDYAERRAASDAFADGPRPCRRAARPADLTMGGRDRARRSCVDVPSRLLEALEHVGEELGGNPAPES